MAGLAAVGYVRASEILMGPLIVALSWESVSYCPEASRVFHKDSPAPRAFLVSFSVGQVEAAAAIMVWGAILLTVFPLGPGPCSRGSGCQLHS